MWVLLNTLGLVLETSVIVVLGRQSTGRYETEPTGTADANRVETAAAVDDGWMSSAS